ncbi:hypothetical protein RMSM_00321 [Rhodopirellula maiorica SM1]|uniref:Uncharacterized protein n=1 Tax=Rhodopirellula maiorica SM1 TaxID=1265738 RepID=M5RU54_9BACT|nr:hypothetical protein RMSM_00321 [Rhodopirellula maiorica SM1]
MEDTFLGGEFGEAEWIKSYIKPPRRWDKRFKISFRYKPVESHGHPRYETANPTKTWQISAGMV